MWPQPTIAGFLGPRSSSCTFFFRSDLSQDPLLGLSSWPGHWSPTVRQGPPPALGSPARHPHPSRLPCPGAVLSPSPPPAPCPPALQVLTSQIRCCCPSLGSRASQSPTVTRQWVPSWGLHSTGADTHISPRPWCDPLGEGNQIWGSGPSLGQAHLRTASEPESGRRLAWRRCWRVLVE